MHEEEKNSLQRDNFGIINPLCIRKNIYYREITLGSWDHLSSMYKKNYLLQGDNSCLGS